MFDFTSTLEAADSYASDKNYALATFHYWLINFAYQDEEFPYFYTEKIGERGRKGFLKYVKKCRSYIMEDESYLAFKNTFNSPKYNSYFENFERVVQYFIRRYDG